MNTSLPSKSISAFVLTITLLGSVPALAEISFKNDIMPLLMRGGCNSGSCHGAARGKDGFKLSLFGYDAEGDYYRLVEEYLGRRVNLAAPEKSLLLEKAAGTVAHTGGEIFTPDTDYYKTLLEWLKAGVPIDADNAPEPTRLELSPSKLTFVEPGKSVQAKVIAYYSDGTQRDVSKLALYMSNNDATVTISDTAVVTANQSGSTHVFARFDRFTSGTEVVVLPKGEFVWPNIPANNYIDELIHAKLKELRILPSDLCTDEQFLRRVTIDLTGKLPTPDEYAAFMSDNATDKRSQLVNELLTRDAFGELWAAKWGEWLRIKTNTNPGQGTAMKAGWNYYHWVRERMIENQPWDKFAQALLSGNGSNLRNPPSNYYTMLPVNKLEPMKLGEDTAQIFLGLRTQCAQCHNHPFDRWTMDDYFGFTSFFTSVRRKHGTEAREYYTFVDLSAEPALHPVDNRPMPAQFLGGELADIKDKDPRKVLAGWMTSGDNKLFRRNLANRVWDHFFGRGLVHPVDDVRISNPPSNEPLMEELGRRLGEVYAYDVKRLVKDICLSRTYQLSPSTNDSNRRDDSQFSHAYLRRLRSDVFFDCISQALETNPKFRRSTADRAVAMFEGGSRDDYNRYFFETFGQASRETVCTCETKTDANLSQALHMINGGTINDAFTRSPVLVPRLMKEHDNAKDVVTAIYIRVLSRKPSEDELNKMLSYAPQATDQRSKQKYFSAVVWALVNSNEFVFNH